MSRPRADTLQSGLNLLRSLQDPSRHDHAQALGALESVVKLGQSDFGEVMVHIFSHGTGDAAEQDLHLRLLAGMLVKNFCLSLLVVDNQPLSSFFRDALMSCLCDVHPQIRRTSANIIGQLCRGRHGSASWLCLVEHLMAPLQHLIAAEPANQIIMARHPAVDGCLYALRLIAEDGGVVLAMDSRLWLEALMPLLLSLLKCSGETVRLSALLTINALLPLLEHSAESVTEYVRPAGSVRSLQEGISALTMHIPALLAELGSLAFDADAEIRCAVCAALVIMAAGPAALLSGCLSEVCTCMAQAVQDPNTDVAKEGLDFWVTLLNREDSLAAVSVHVATLSNTCVRYFRMTREQLDTKREEEASLASGETPTRLSNRNRKYNDDNGKSDTYSLRELSGKLFEKLAESFPQDVLSTAGPLITQRLNVTSGTVSAQLGLDPQFSVVENVSLLRESAMIALGAIANVDSTLVLHDALPALYPVLLSMLTDPLEETRAAACWTLSRFDDWVVDEINSPEEHICIRGRGNITLLLQGLLSSMGDISPKVQCAACTALQHCISSCGCDTILSVGVLLPLTQHIGSAFLSYGVRNKLCLLNVVGCLAQELGGHFCAVETGGAEGVQHWFPFVFAMFNNSSDADDDAHDVAFEVAAECLTEVVPSIGPDVQSYAGAILARCAHMAAKCLEEFTSAEAAMRAEQAAQMSGASLKSLSAQLSDAAETWDLPSKDNIIASLELLAALFDALGPMGASVLQGPNLGPHLASILGISFQCLRDEMHSCRQAAYSLLTSVIKVSPGLLSSGSHVSVALAAILEEFANFVGSDDVDDQFDRLLSFNNACYALGLLAIAASRYAPLSGLCLESAGLMDAALPRLLFQLVESLRIVAKLDNQHSFENADLVLQTLATSICHLGLVCPMRMAVILPEILFDLLSSMKRLDACTERDGEFGLAWLGLLTLLNTSPRALLDSAVAGAAFVNLCASQVAMPQTESELEDLKKIGCPCWNACPSVLVSDEEFNRGISAILQALAQAQPKTFAAQLTVEVKSLLAAFE
jgi:hypothetical protein